jgi:transposase InsO family protein
MATKPG